MKFLLNSIWLKWFLFFILFDFACGENNKTSIVNPLKSPEIENSDLKIVAKVMGNPVYANEVTELIEKTDGGLLPEDAVEALVRRELLALEAQKLGYADKPQVAIAKKTLMAKEAIKKIITQKINPDTIEEKTLREIYKINKKRFVHGIQRQILHILFRTKSKNGFKNDEAYKIAEKALQKAEKIKSENEFKEFYKELNTKHKKKITIEELPPFEKDSKQFVKPFVDSVFAINFPDKKVNLANTRYGWHVIYIIKEIPALNLSFNDAKKIIIPRYLPILRKEETKKYLKELYENGNIFIFHDALKEASKQNF